MLGPFPDTWRQASVLYDVLTLAAERRKCVEKLGVVSQPRGSLLLYAYSVSRTAVRVRLLFRFPFYACYCTPLELTAADGWCFALTFTVTQVEPNVTGHKTRWWCRHRAESSEYKHVICTCWHYDYKLETCKANAKKHAPVHLLKQVFVLLQIEHTQLYANTHSIHTRVHKHTHLTFVWYNIHQLTKQHFNNNYCSFSCPCWKVLRFPCQDYFQPRLCS